jgi:hypothetical protein
MVFVDTFFWFPIAFIAGLLALLAAYHLWLKKPSPPRQKG